MSEGSKITNSELLLATMAGMFILAIGLVLFFFAYKKRILEQQKEHQRKEAEYQQQLMRANLLSQEKERNRIGKDLHDEVGAMLSTSRLYFQHLDQTKDSEEFGALKEKALKLLEDTMGTVRRVSHNLKPVVLERLGLVEAIANMAEQLNESGALHVSFKNYLTQSMSQEFELNWFRIVQELLNNSLKHANATEIDMELSSEDEMVAFVYKDNGVGFKDKSGLDTGLGMQNIQSRLGLMAGGLEIVESETQGVFLKMKSALELR